MLPVTSSTDLNLLLENLLFLALSTLFLVLAGRVWRDSKPFSIPEPLPRWLSAWIAIVQVFGVALPPSHSDRMTQILYNHI